MKETGKLISVEHLSINHSLPVNVINISNTVQSKYNIFFPHYGKIMVIGL